MLRDILLGVGITLITLALILIVFDNLTVVEKTDLTKTEIINRARELGMFFPGEKNSEELSLKRETSLEARELDKSNLAANEDALVVVEENDLSRTKIINKASDMGMFFPWKKNKQNILLNQRTNLEINELNKLDSLTEEVITLEIPAGISSREITDLLVEKKLIKDRSSFIKLLSKFDLENKVMSGTYSFSPQTSPLKLLVVLTTD
ncbi:MAG: hypothetical protein ACQEP9_01410 [Bacillota bacterium]